MPRHQFRQPMYSLAGRYDNPIPTRCLAPIDFLKIPALTFAFQNIFQKVGPFMKFRPFLKLKKLLYKKISHYQVVQRFLKLDNPHMLTGAKLSKLYSQRR
jgi:hypothetical protein